MKRQVSKSRQSRTVFSSLLVFWKLRVLYPDTNSATNALRENDFGKPAHKQQTAEGVRLRSPRWCLGSTRQSHHKHSCRQAFYSFTQPRVSRHVLIRVRPRLQIVVGFPASQPSGQQASVQLLLVARVALSAAAAHGLRKCQEVRCTSLLSSSRRLSPFRTYSNCQAG